MRDAWILIGKCRKLQSQSGRWWAHGRRTGFFCSTAGGRQSCGGATWEPVSLTADDLLSSEPQRPAKELDHGWTHFNDVFAWNSDHFAIGSSLLFVPLYEEIFHFRQDFQ